MKHYLMGEGIPAEAIFTDSEGWNTYDTAKNTIRLMEANGYQSALLVSQYYHISGASLLFAVTKKNLSFSSCRFF